VSTKSKVFSLLALVVILSVVATTVAAQPNSDANPKTLSDIIMRTNLPQPEPPEPELMLTDPYVSEPVAPADTTGLPPAPTVDPYAGEPRETIGRLYPPKAPVAVPESHDAAVQQTLGAAAIPPTIVNFEGVNNRDGVYPPDTDGQVGPNHYVQMVNLSTAIYDKSGNLLYGPFHPNDLWPDTPEHAPCHNTNDGDPVVLYDQLADRWLLTQFGLPNYPVGPYYQCIAVSKTGTPTNNPNDWYPYTFLVHQNKMNDYPKLGIWPDGYYMSANQFPDDPTDRYTAGAWVFERDKMLAGQPATFQFFDLEDLDATRDYFSLLPSNLMGSTLPPTGTPNYFASVNQNWVGTDDIFHLFAFHVDWDTPANTTFTLVKDMVVDDYTTLCPGTRSCIPQPDTTQGLDSLSSRLMMHLWYRNFGDHESLVVNHTVDAGGGRAGVRWYEVRDPGTAAYIYQQSTFAPDDGLHRWMGSIAMDRVGNIALGYSIASSSLYPSIRYTGRLAGDPLNQMTLGEGVIITGTGSQTGTGARWGDYSAMSVDPVDDCTFWYTQEYIETTGTISWQTRIASFRFPSCMEGTGALKGTVTSASTGNPIEHARVSAQTNPTYIAYTHADGSYGFSYLPAGTYTVTAEVYGYQPNTITGVTVAENTTTTQDIQLTPWPMYVISGFVTDQTTGWPLYSRIDIAGYPYSPIWNDPVTGFYSVTLSSTTPHTFTVSSWVNGYEAEELALGQPTGDATHNFALSAASSCSAPGYTPTAVASVETFDTSNGGYTHAGAQDEWEWGAPAIWPYGCHSGDNCWGTDLDGLYNSNADQVLTSTVISLSAYPSGTILTARWWQAWSSEATFDFAYAEVSINGGDWVEMWHGDGIQNDWTEMSYDISAAAGGNVQFRWRLTSDGGVNMEGYYIDDVSVTVGCTDNPGGLLVGNVYSATQPTEALVGALIASDLGETAIAMKTPRDPQVDDAFYTIFSPSGVHTFTALLRGYGPATETPNIVAGEAVQQDFYLGAPQMYVVSGTVTDASTGWPLYARVTVEDESYWNDPATGYYSVTLPEAFPYSFEVIAWVEGYESARRTVGPLTADTTENFTLTADLVICNAPGREFNALLYESFEDADFPPAGWTVYDEDGAEETWARGARSYTGDASAVHLYGPQGHVEDGWLVTPAFTPTAASELTFWESVDYASYYVKHSLLACTSDCDTLTNFTEIAEFDNPEEDTWVQHTVDLSSYAGAPLQLAFRYEGEWADSWFIDQIVVSPTSCDQLSGGMVVGNVYDANTGKALNNAQVINATGDIANAVATPDDPAVADGFYTLFSPAGSQTFSGTMKYYQPDVDTFSVVLSDTVAHDFDLTAGQLAYTPAQYAVTLDMGDSVTVPITLTNTGSAPLSFDLDEVPGGFTPAARTLTTGNRGPVRGRFSAQSFKSNRLNAPWPASDEINLVLDDGSGESALGLTSGGQFIWLNRFTPDPGDFPFSLRQVSVLFGADTGVTVTDQVDIYIYEDTDGDGDPGTNARFLGSINDAAVQAVDDVTWSNFTLTTPIDLYVPGDVLIAVVNRTAGINAGDHPAAMDTTASQGRSWIGIYSSGDPADPPTLPPDALWGVVDSFGFPGNWMIRGSGLSIAPDVPWLSEDPVTGTLASAGVQVVNLTFDAGAVDQPGDYRAMLKLWNNTPYTNHLVPLTITIAPRPEPTWYKMVYINDVLTDTFPATVAPDDTIEVVDQMWFTYTGNVTFTLTEEWSESLRLVTYTVAGLPGGTAIVPGYGTVLLPTDDRLIFEVADNPSDWGYVVTKTFTVLSGDWETDLITETLWVDGAYPQPDSRVLRFTHSGASTIYLPLVMRNH